LYTEKTTGKGYNAKLVPNRVGCVILKRQGNSLYELGNGTVNRIGVYHAKDLFAA